MEAFRLGIQKCKKTIQESVSTGAVFKVPGVDVLFHMLRRAADLKTARSHFVADIGNYLYHYR